MKVHIGPYPKGKKERKVEVHIDGYDLWNMDHTLALIIAPMLKLMKEAKHGAPNVDNEDSPENLQYHRSSPESDYNIDEDVHYFERWDYVLDEMIFAFEKLAAGSDWHDVDCEEIRSRINNGVRLFGKYYRALWY